MSATIVKIAAGVGKTTEAAHAIAECLGIVEVYTPTHKLSAEWKEKILAINPNKRVQIIHGRNQKTDQGVFFCKKHILADEVARAGCSVFPNLCRKSQGQGQPPIHCEHYASCTYIQQFGGAEVYIYPHTYLGLERSMLEQYLPNLVVIDESFWTSCIDTLQLNISILRDPALPAGAIPLCRQLADAFSQGNLSLGEVISSADRDETLLSAMRALRRAPVIASPDMTPRQIRTRIRQSLPLRIIRIMLHQLRVESQYERPIHSVQFDQATGVITIHHKKEITRFAGRGLRRALKNFVKFLVLDASADRRIIEQFLAVREFVDIAVKRNAYVTQCYSTSCPNSRLNPERSADAQSSLNELQQIIDRYANQYNNLLVVGPTLVCGNPQQNKPPAIKAQSNVSFEHFGALRGIDAYKDFEAVIIIGRNQPPWEAIESDARALYFDHPDPLLLDVEPINDPRGYSIADDARGVMVQVHPDPRLQAIMEQRRERETEQAIDRLRSVHHAGAPKEVLIISNLVLDIEVDRLCSWNELVGGGNRIEQAFSRRTDGVLPLNPKWLAANYPDLWATEAAAKKDIGRKKGQISISNTIGKMSLLESQYRPAGQRSWSRCLSAQNDPQYVQSALQALFGTSVKYRIGKPG